MEILRFNRPIGLALYFSRWSIHELRHNQHRVQIRKKDAKAFVLSLLHSLFHCCETSILGDARESPPFRLIHRERSSLTDSHLLEEPSSKNQSRETRVFRALGANDARLSLSRAYKKDNVSLGFCGALLPKTGTINNFSNLSPAGSWARRGRFGSERVGK